MNPRPPEEDLNEDEMRKAFSGHGMKSAGLSGAASGRQARGDAIDMMLQRRQKARTSMQGKAKRSGSAPTSKGIPGRGDSFDTEKAIKGGY
jgi:hypothetical protein